jgi:16S rRNA (guanine527-N7)-methyltransferase
LVLVERWECETVLVDSMQKRMNFLHETLGWPGAPEKVTVITGRAEVIAREPGWESVFSLVTARSFGLPAVVAECATRFLRLGGSLIVSEPPEDDPRRWNSEILEEMGLRDDGRVRHGAAFRRLTKIAETPQNLPRGVGVPSKRPLF